MFVLVLVAVRHMDLEESFDCDSRDVILVTAALAAVFAVVVSVVAVLVIVAVAAGFAS